MSAIGNVSSQVTDLRQKLDENQVENVNKNKEIMEKLKSHDQKLNEQFKRDTKRNIIFSDGPRYIMTHIMCSGAKFFNYSLISWRFKGYAASTYMESALWERRKMSFVPRYVHRTLFTWQYPTLKN